MCTVTHLSRQNIKLPSLPRTLKPRGNCDVTVYERECRRANGLQKKSAGFASTRGREDVGC